MKNTKNLVETFVEIEPLDDDSFLKLAETLTRVGFIRSPRKSGKPRLSQICHVYHRHGRYYLVHFKQLFMLEGIGEGVTVYTKNDMDALNSVINLVKRWGLARPIVELERSTCRVKVVNYSDKDNWDLQPNFHHNRLWKKKPKAKHDNVTHENRTSYQWY